MQSPKYTLAVLGGTGNEGPGLALRWANAGHTVIIGSRTEEKALRVASELNDVLGKDVVQGMENSTAAAACDLAVLTVPFSVQNVMLEGLKAELEGKLLITTSVALKPPKVARVFIPAEGSASEQAQAVLGEGTRVVAAFQNVSAHYLMDLDADIACDVLVCGNKKADKAYALQLAADAGMKGVDAGPLCNAKAIESMTSVLIGINIRYKVHGAGIKITHLPE